MIIIMTAGDTEVHSGKCHIHALRHRPYLLEKNSIAPLDPAGDAEDA